MNSHDLIHRSMQISPVEVSTGLNTFSFNHPEQVVRDPVLAPEQKREILASWASDQHAVSDKPNLRQLNSGAVLEVKKILDALRVLDNMERSLGQLHRPFGRRSGVRQSRRSVSPGWRSRKLGRDGQDGGDDDPPPVSTRAIPPDWRPSPTPAVATLRIPSGPAGEDAERRITKCLLAAA